MRLYVPEWTDLDGRVLEQFLYRADRAIIKAPISPILNVISITRVQREESSPKYKILTGQIEQFRVSQDVTYNINEKSQLEFGFRIAVKERSPKQKFEEWRDVCTRSDGNAIIDYFKEEWKVSDNEVFYRL